MHKQPSPLLSQLHLSFEHWIFLSWAALGSIEDSYCTTLPFLASWTIIGSSMIVGLLPPSWDLLFFLSFNHHYAPFDTLLLLLVLLLLHKHQHYFPLHAKNVPSLFCKIPGRGCDKEHTRIPKSPPYNLGNFLRIPPKTILISLLNWFSCRYHSFWYFNDCTWTLQTLIHDLVEDVLWLHEVNPCIVGAQIFSIDRSYLVMTHGRYLQLNESHDLIILNGVPCYLGFNRYTCFPHNCGVSVVDYVLANQALLP